MNNNRRTDNLRNRIAFRRLCKAIHSTANWLLGATVLASVFIAVTLADWVKWALPKGDGCDRGDV